MPKPEGSPDGVGTSSAPSLQKGVVANNNVCKKSPDLLLRVRVVGEVFLPEYTILLPCDFIPRCYTAPSTFCVIVSARSDISQVPFYARSRKDLTGQRSFAVIAINGFRVRVCFVV